MNTLTNKDKNGLKIILTILAVYAVCLLFRCLEYFLIRTDQTFFGEAFIHKLLGIAVCFLVLLFLHIKPSNAGFRIRRAPKYILYGAILGMLTPKRQKLIYDVFFLEKSYRAIAREQGVAHSSISQQMKTVYKHLRKFLGVCR